MKQVQYSRILHRPLTPYQFNRSISAIASTVVLFVLSASINSKIILAHEFTTDLQTCCEFQSQYNEDNGTCEVSNSETIAHGTDSLLKFPETWELHQYLIPRVYRNKSVHKTFNLKPKLISCPNGTITINITLSHPQKPILRGNLRLLPLVIAPGTGYLRHHVDVFYPDEYCFNRINENELQIQVCQPVCSETYPCIPKCCDIGQVMDLSDYPDGAARCEFEGDKIWSPKVYSKVRVKNPLDNVRPHVVYSSPKLWCKDEAIIHTLKPFLDERRTPFRILQTGEVWYKFDRITWASFTQGAHCIDGYFSKSVTNSGSFSGDFDDTVVWDCGPPLIVSKPVKTSQLYGVSMVIAALFLLITVIVYMLLWDKQNVHGWTLLSYFTSLFFMYIFYAAAHFSSMSLVQDGDGVNGGGTVCYIIGVGAHFFFLCSFCFMSAVNFDLWWTFRALMPTGGRSKGIKKFLAYLVFSLGIPIVIVTVGVTLDRIYRDDIESDVIIPEYGKLTCYLDTQYAALPYLHGPAAILLTCNLIFFTVTVYTMYKIQQSTKFATMSSSKNAKQKQSMVLFAKLCLVMGLPWVVEVVSSTLQRGAIVPIYFQIFDMINILQAVAIFIIFVLKTDIRNSLENKYPLFRRFILAITLRPEQADSILRRHPRLRFIINPLTRSIASNRSFSTAKTTLSNGTEGSTSSRANVLHRGSFGDALERSSSTSSSSARSSPSGSLNGKKGDSQNHPEILELR